MKRPADLSLLALALTAAASLAVPAYSEYPTGEAQFLKDLTRVETREDAPAVQEAGTGAPAYKLYAEPVLKGWKNEHIRIVTIDDSGDRAILERIAPGALLFPGKTELTLLERGTGEWHEKNLLIRSNGKWIGGVSLSALAISGDGRYLLYTRLKDLENYDSQILKTLNLDTGRSEDIAPWKKSMDSDSNGELAKIVANSGWFKITYSGRPYEEVFSDSKERCKGESDIKAGVSSSDFAPDVASKSFVVQKPGAERFVYPLKDLPGTSAWTYQGGDWRKAMSKDCTRGLTTVEELLESQSPSFFFGRMAYNAHMRVMAFGQR